MLIVKNRKKIFNKKLKENKQNAIVVLFCFFCLLKVLRSVCTNFLLVNEGGIN